MNDVDVDSNLVPNKCGVIGAVRLGFMVWCGDGAMGSGGAVWCFGDAVVW